MKPSEALHGAKDYLAQSSSNGAFWSNYICVALATWKWLAKGDYDELREAANAAQDEVIKAIQGHSTLFHFLRAKGVIPYSMPIKSPEYYAIRDHWLDALIAKLEAEGK